MTKSILVENEYHSRINRAIDFIEANVEKQFTLEDLASAANFSKFHFNRIFSSCMGETPFQFIMRVRIERAASLLITNSKESVTQIAFKCGFTELAIFSRNFKKYFRKSASSYRLEKISNISQMNSKKNKARQKTETYFCPNSNKIKWRTEMKLSKSVEVRQIPQMTVAYLRHTGPYKGDESLFEKLWNQLFTWAGPRGLIGGPDFKSLVIYQADPNVTEESKLRMRICISIPRETEVDGVFGKLEIQSGKYVVARFVVNASQFQEAWEWVYGTWFPTSGYQPDDGPCFEMYPEEPKDGNFTVDICGPVKPL